MKRPERHGETRGGRRTPEYGSYAEMIRRCHDPKRPAFIRYGGRGITVCRSWRKSFSAFLRSVGRRPSAAHSLERRNNAQGYRPSNVYWATVKEQNRNTRRNLYLDFRGARKSLAEWVEQLGLSYDSVKRRLYLGWSVKRAFTTPVRKNVRLNEIQQEELVQMYVAGRADQYALASMFGVDQSTVSLLVNRRKVTP